MPKGLGGELFADGASRGNPGHSGAGAVLFEAGGARESRHSAYIGQATNNQAEYRALILGLEEALGLGWTWIRVHLDSELVVKQLGGSYRVKSPGLKPLFRKASGLLDRFSDFEITHIPREKNAQADRLANRAVDEALKKPYNI